VRWWERLGDEGKSCAEVGERRGGVGYMMGRVVGGTMGEGGIRKREISELGGGGGARGRVY